jgi:putative DNA primase/helicase
VSILNSPLADKLGISLPLNSKHEIIEAEEKPPRTIINFDAIPSALKERDQCVLWKWIKKNGRWTKVPYSIKGRKAKANDPKTWSSFAQVKIIFEGNPDYDGIGYEFSADDPYTGVDLDNAIDLQTGELKPWAEKVIADLATVTHISPTFTGVKLMVRGKKPPGANHCKVKFHDGELEIYDRKHFFTITGWGWPGTKLDINECSEKIAALYAEAFGEADEPQPLSHSCNERTFAQTDLSDEDAIRRCCQAPGYGEKFKALLNGSSDGYPSDSEGDLAFCSYIGWWVRWDRSRIDQIFRSSSRMRDKWKRKDYRERTLSKACDGQSGGYEPQASAVLLLNGCHIGNGTSKRQGARSDRNPPDLPDPNGRGDPPSEPHLTDHGNAQRMIAWHGDALRHCFPWKKWVIWTGSQWQADATAEATRRAKATIKRVFVHAAAEVQAIRDEMEDESSE